MGGLENNRDENQQDNVNNTGSLHYSNQSQAEATLSKYGNRDGTNATSHGHLHTRRGPHGLECPFDPGNPSYLSKFNVNFRGCFKCGSTEHWDRKS